ncbi:Uncharacterised protein [Bordetella pertussis]|nr:Uncharacterised protein [Bordetella pertussis]
MRTGVAATPPRVIEARATQPASSSSSSTATDTMAKSPWRRANSTKAWPWPAGHGVTARPTSISSGSSAGVM